MKLAHDKWEVPEEVVEGIQSRERGEEFGQIRRHTEEIGMRVWVIKDD